MQDLEKRAQELAELERQEKEKELAIKENNEGTSLAPSVESNSDEIDINKLQSKYLSKQIEDGKMLHEVSQDLAKAQAIKTLLTDDSKDVQKYRQELLDEEKVALKESFKQDTAKEKKKTIEERQRKNEAFYKSVRPVLEFDFSNLIKDDKYIKTNGQKQYEDRSYGKTLMIFMLIFLTVPYFATSLLLALFNGINSIFCQVATFGKVSRSIVVTLLILFFVALVVYCVLLGIENIFGVPIFPK